jgi:hypothetical protein
MAVPDRTLGWNTAGLVGAPTFHEALNSDTASYIWFPDSYDRATGWVQVGMETPAGLTDDYKWARGEVLIAARREPSERPTLWAAVEAVLDRQPKLYTSTSKGGGPDDVDDWIDTPLSQPAGTSRLIQGPRSLFTGGVWTVRAAPQLLSSGGVYYAAIQGNALRFELLDYLNPPTTGIVGPVSTTEIVNGSYIPAQWTFTPSVTGFSYAGWKLEVARNADGSGVIYAASGTSGTTHQIPAKALSGYVGTQLYVRIQTIQNVPRTHLPPSPSNAWRQYGPWAQAAFTPIGEITATYMAVRPSVWVDDLDDTARELLTRSHAPTFAAQLYTWDGAQTWPLEILDGEVAFDASQQVRTTFSLTVANAELRARQVYPMDPERPLHPFGSYVQLARGVGDRLVALCAGVVEEVSADVTVSGEGPVTVRGSDWARWFADARLSFTRARQVWTGSAWARDFVTTVLRDLATEAGLTAVVNGSSTARVVPNYVTARTAVRPELADALCAELGWWWWADTFGRIVFEPVPVQTGTPRYRFVEGDSCVVLRHTAALTRAEMYDLAVAYDDAGLFVGGAYDGNPDSPIRRGAGNPATPTVGAGPFGPGGKPFFFASPVITSLASAQTAARTTLARRAVPAERITIEIIPHPDLRAGHLIEVERVGESPRPWIVSAGTIPLSSQRPMTVDAYSPVDYVQPAN